MRPLARPPYSLFAALVPLSGYLGRGHHSFHEWASVEGPDQLLHGLLLDLSPPDGDRIGEFQVGIRIRNDTPVKGHNAWLRMRAYEATGCDVGIVPNSHRQTLSVILTLGEWTTANAPLRSDLFTPETAQGVWGKIEAVAAIDGDEFSSRQMGRFEVPVDDDGGDPFADGAEGSQ